MKTRISFPALLVISLILLVALACSTTTIIPGQATEPPVPTTAPSLTPIPSSTPDLAATLSAQATLAAAQRENDIKAILNRVDISSDTGHLLWDQEEPIAITMNGPDSLYQPFAEGIVASDFVLQTDMTWNTNSWPVCGIWFRSEDTFTDGAQYQLLFLRLSGLPAWSIEYHQFDRFVFNVTRQVKYSNDLNLDDGATNRFLLVANDNEFTLYINGKRQGRYYDDSRKLGQGVFAFYGSQDGKNTTCTFKDTWIWSLK